MLPLPRSRDNADPHPRLSDGHGTSPRQEPNCDGRGTLRRFDFAICTASPTPPFITTLRHRQGEALAPVLR